MPSVPRVSVIIVSWNGKELLQQCLPSVVATSYDNVEIILADNNSSDGSKKWVRDTFGDEVKIVRHPENWAFCRGNNAAAAHATGKYLVLLNNDVEVPEDWLHPLVRLMEANPEVAAVQPKLLQYDRRDHFEYAGGSGGFIDRYGYPFTRGRLFDTMERDVGQYDDERDIFWATGAALMVRRRAFEEVGMLDERFVLHMEEIDLCWRLARRGYRIKVAPESHVYHIGGSSLPQTSPEKTYYNFRNSLLMLYKNLPPSAWYRTLPGRLALDMVAILYLLARGDWKRALAVIQAYRDALRMLSRYSAERSDTTASENTILPPYRGSIVIDYFLRGHQTFQELPADRFHHPERRTSPLPSRESRA